MSKWSTLSGLEAVRIARGNAIPGWRPPVAYAVGFRVGGQWVFPHVNEPGGFHRLPAVMLAEVLGYSSGTREFRLTRAQLDDAIARLAPAEACTDCEHPNLWNWRVIAGAEPTDIAAVFVGDLDDPIAGEVDRALRERL